MGRRRAANDPSIRTTLSDRQQEVLALIAAGRTNAEIAGQLGLSLDGAKWHVREILSRLGVESREEAAELWRNQRDPWRRLRAWAPAGTLVLGGAGVAAVAALVVVVVALGGDSPNAGADEPPASSTASATVGATATGVAWNLAVTNGLPQPELVEAETGDEWRLLKAWDGTTPSHASRVVLAIDYDGPFDTAGPGSELRWPHVDVVEPDGRVTMRVETGYRPMARLNPANNTLVVSDVIGKGEDFHARVLVFALDRPRLLSEVPLPQQRVNFTVFGNAITLSPDGRWLYWVEHTQQREPESCQRGGDESVCDLLVIHAVDLDAMENTSLAVEMPRACAVPRTVPYQGSAILAVCNAREGSKFVIDAAAPQQVRPVPASAPFASTRYLWDSLGNVGLDLDYTNVGSLTAARLVDRTTGERLASQPLPDAYGAILVDERTLLVNLADGSLHHLDMYTGLTTRLPYSIDPGPSGLSVVFQR